MIFLSQLLNREIADLQGRRVGTLGDLVISKGEVFPRVTAIVIVLAKPKGLPISSGTITVPWSAVESLEERPVRLNVSRDKAGTYQPKEDDLLLGRDILDKQIVDTQGRRIVKVNDLKLAQIRGVVRLVGADISLRAFLRRLGAEGLLSKVLPVRLPERLITWNYVEPLDAALANVRLSIPQSKIADLHPADIADLIEQMEPAEGTAVLRGLPDSTAANTLTELEPDVQASLIQSLDPDRASDLLEIMPPDEAADILGDLSREKAEELLAHMTPVEAEDVRGLMRYDEHSAGGIMTTDVVRLRRQLTVEEAIAVLRQAAPEAEVAYYLYVVDDDRLVGVVSLRDIVISLPQTSVGEIMDREVVKVRVDADQEEVARLIAKYDLLAIPVVDHDNHLLGMVTVDDVVDVLQEEAEEDISQIAGYAVGDGERRGSPLSEAVERLSWLSLWLAGGLIIGLIVRAFSQSIQSTLPLAYFLPLLLLVVGGAVAQAIAAVGHALGLGHRRHVILREAEIAAVTGLVSGASVALLVFLWARNPGFALILGTSLCLSVVVAALAGALIALLGSKTEISRTVLSNSTLEPLVAVFSVTVYLVLATFLMDHIIG